MRQQHLKPSNLEAVCTFSLIARDLIANLYTADHELSAKLESEIQLEAEATQEDSADELPAHLKDYLDQNPWNIVDASGTEEVVLTRRFGKEK